MLKEWREEATTWASFDDLPSPKRPKLGDTLTPRKMQSLNSYLRKVQNGGVTPEIDRRAGR